MSDVYFLLLTLVLFGSMAVLVGFIDRFDRDGNDGRDSR